MDDDKGGAPTSQFALQTDVDALGRAIKELTARLDGMPDLPPIVADVAALGSVVKAMGVDLQRALSTVETTPGGLTLPTDTALRALAQSCESVRASLGALHTTVGRPVPEAIAEPVAFTAAADNRVTAIAMALSAERQKASA